MALFILWGSISIPKYLLKSVFLARSNILSRAMRMQLWFVTDWTGVPEAFIVEPCNTVRRVLWVDLFC